MRRVDSKLYDEEYYLKGCSGYQEFKTSLGRKLEPRLVKIKEKIPSVKGLKVLDIGTGRGEMVFWAARNGASSAVGIDYSKAAINLANQAKASYPSKIQKKVQFLIKDAKSADFKKNFFDAVLLIEVLEHLYPEEQEKILGNIYKILKPGGFVFVHTAPSKWFNDYTYKYWCYPLSSLLVRIWNLVLNKRYPNIAHPKRIRSNYEKIMHVAEPDYFSMKKLFEEKGFRGSIYSTNITITKPVHSIKDAVFNFLVYLYPLSNYFPLNIFWGNDFYAVLKR